jgi:hypothetical protein
MAFHDHWTGVAELVKVRTETKKSEQAMWTCGDGKRVKVRDMTDSHLFFAIAKGRRGEYPDSVTRKAGVEALEAEALRRLTRDLA